MKKLLLTMVVAIVTVIQLLGSLVARISKH